MIVVCQVVSASPFDFYVTNLLYVVGMPWLCFLSLALDKIQCLFFY